MECHINAEQCQTDAAGILLRDVAPSAPTNFDDRKLRTNGIDNVSRVDLRWFYIIACCPLPRRNNSIFVKRQDRTMSLQSSLYLIVRCLSRADFSFIFPCVNA